MFWVFLAGLTVGGGIWLALSRLAPATPSLAGAGARLDRRPAPTVIGSATADASTAARLGRLMTPRFGADLVRLDRVGRDLAVTDTPLDVHLGQKVLWSLAGGFSIPVIVALLAASGTSVGLTLPSWLAILGATGCFFVPDFAVRERATQRRKEFRQCLGAYTDLVVMLLAANEGVTGALEHAAVAGDAWPFVEVRRSLAQARLSAAAPWTALRELGECYGVDELVELASSAQLSGAEGASVRLSLIAKAGTLRDRALSAEEAAAEESSTRMVFPLLLLVLSFVVFVGYPALVSVLQS
jgi:tight adherence protein C